MNTQHYTRSTNWKWFGNNEDFINLVSSQWENFKNINGRYPTAQEIDRSNNMVSTKTIQRRIGGLGKMRKILGHNIVNYSSGEARSIISSENIKRSLDDEIELSNWLISIFGDKLNVIIEERYMGHSKHRSDCGVYYNGKHFFVDIFHAKDRYSLSGCITFKQKKICGISDNVYFVSSNGDITQECIDDVIGSKKNKLPQNAHVMTMDNFKKLCNTIVGVV